MSKKEAAINLKTLTTGSCKTLSGRRTLQYAVCTDPAGKLYFRITGNDGGGNFASEPVSWEAIEDVLEAEDDGFSSLALRPLFKNRSSNNAPFMLGILRHLDLVAPMEGKQKIFELLDPESFVAEMEALKSADAPAKKAPAKKKKAPRKKAAAGSA